MLLAPISAVRSKINQIHFKWLKQMCVTAAFQVCNNPGHLLHRKKMWESEHTERHSGSSDWWCSRDGSSDNSHRHRHQESSVKHFVEDELVHCIIQQWNHTKCEVNIVGKYANLSWAFLWYVPIFKIKMFFLYLDRSKGFSNIDPASALLMS